MQEKIALYWDFENIHASAMTSEYGQSWFQKYKHKPQPNVLDIKAIMDYINSLGDVVVNKSYADYHYLHRYATELNEHAIDLIQIFPRGYNGKNGADIRLSIDIVEDITLMPYITTVVLLSGDSDFISVAKRVRQRGLRIIGIGLKATSNKFWIKTCNEFKFYDNILSDLDDEVAEVDQGDVDTEEARALVTKAMRQLIRNGSSEWVKRVRIKPALIRLDPSFDERNYGETSFGRFLDNVAAKVLEYREVQGQQEPEYRLKENASRSRRGSRRKPSVPIDSIYEKPKSNRDNGNDKRSSSKGRNESKSTNSRVRDKNEQNNGEERSSGRKRGRSKNRREQPENTPEATPELAPDAVNEQPVENAPVENVPVEETEQPEAVSTPKTEYTSEDLVKLYNKVLLNQGIRILDFDLMKAGIRVYANFVKKKRTFKDNATLDEVTAEELQATHPDAGVTEARKLRHILYKCFLFKKTVEAGIGFHEDVKGIRDIEERYFRLILRRVADNIDGQELQYGPLSTVVFGKATRARTLQKLAEGE